MSYVNKTVSINGTEKDFIKAFANELTSADNRITCETDIDAEFANEDSSHIITIIFDVNNCYKIKLIRAVAINKSTYQYNIQTVINNVDKSSAGLFFSSAMKFVTDIATRTIKNFAQSNVPPRSRRGIARQVSLVVNMRGLPTRRTKLSITNALPKDR